MDDDSTRLVPVPASSGPAVATESSIRSAHFIRNVPFSFDISPKFEVWPCLGGLHASAMISPARWAAPLPDSRRVTRPRERRSVRLGPFVVGIHREHGYRPRRLYRVTSRQSDGSFRCDRPLRDGLGRRSARLVRAVFSTLADRQQRPGRSTWSTCSRTRRLTPPMVCRGASWKMAANVTEPPLRVTRDQAPPTAPTRRNIHGLTRLLR